MDLWVLPIYKAFIVATVIAFIISLATTGNVSFGATLSGYCLLILFICFILVTLFKSISKTYVNSGFLSVILSGLMLLGPFVLLLGVIGFLMYLNIFYMTPIINNQVSQGYYTFNNMAIVIILLQIYIVYQNISSEQFERTNKMSKVTSSLLYLFGTLTLIFSLILYTILKYFRTDG